MKYVKLYAVVFTVIFGLGIASAEAKAHHSLSRKKPISKHKAISAKKKPRISMVKAKAPIAPNVAPVAAADMSSEFFKPCVETTYMKSTLNRSQSDQLCSHIQNKYALACTQIAVNYIRLDDQSSLVASCSAIQTEQALTCMIQNAVPAANSVASQKIASCAGATTVAAK